MAPPRRRREISPSASVRRCSAIIRCRRATRRPPPVLLTQAARSPLAATVRMPTVRDGRPARLRRHPALAKLSKPGTRLRSAHARSFWRDPKLGKSLFATVTLVALVAPTRAQDFPDGPGKQTVGGVCGGCHDINRQKAGYTPEGWQTIIAMMKNFGAQVPEGEWPVVAEYVTKNFPEKPRPAAAIIPGPAEATIREWPVPTPGSRPHDPVAAHDGSIWYSGQLANAVGRLDPKTGEFKEFHLKRPQTAPHGITEDKDGNIWFTGNFAGLIGKLDPKTGEVTEYKLPDPAAKDPHTLIFDHDGILWFTVQQGNRVGRLDPKTGEIKLVTPPTANARPYGMAVNSQNVVFFVEFGANKVATIDGKTMEIKEYPLPDPA